MGIDEDLHEQSNRATASLRRPGRPQRLPFDATASDLPEIDATRRLAWLLATTRLLAPATAALGRSAFVERLQGEGLTVDTTRLSRWESGSTPVSVAVLRAYERQARVPSGSLLAASLLLRRHSEAALGVGSGITGRAGRSELLTSETTDDLDQVFDLVDSQRATGGDWLSLASEINRFERVYLHPSSWTAVCGQLVNELARSSGAAFLRRYEAAALLMRHPAARRQLGRSLGSFVMHPDVQNAAPALSLLSEVGDSAAGDLVVRLLTETNPVVRRGAMGVAVAMAARGQLPASSESALEAAASRELRKGNPSRRAAAFELAAQLPAASYGRLMATTSDKRTRKHAGQVRATQEMVAPDLARTVADSVAGHAESAMGRAAHDPDRMLRKLVREGLFHALRDRRHLAAALLAASQYAAPVAEAVLRLTRDRDEMVASMAWSMLRRLSASIDRDTVERLVPGAPPALQVRALVTLGLARGELSEGGADQLLEVATSSETSHTVRHATIFALGMVGHPHLHALTRHQRTCDASDWWLAVGDSLHDADATIAAN